MITTLGILTRDVVAPYCLVDSGTTIGTHHSICAEVPLSREIGAIRCSFRPSLVYCAAFAKMHWYSAVNAVLRATSFTREDLSSSLQQPVAVTTACIGTSVEIWHLVHALFSCFVVAPVHLVSLIIELIGEPLTASKCRAWPQFSGVARPAR